MNRINNFFVIYFENFIFLIIEIYALKIVYHFLSIKQNLLLQNWQNHLIQIQFNYQSIGSNDPIKYAS